MTCDLGELKALFRFLIGSCNELELKVIVKKKLRLKVSTLTRNKRQLECRNSIHRTNNDFLKVREDSIDSIINYSLVTTLDE